MLKERLRPAPVDGYVENPVGTFEGPVDPLVRQVPQLPFVVTTTDSDRAVHRHRKTLDVSAAGFAQNGELCSRLQVPELKTRVPPMRGDQHPPAVRAFWQ